MPTKSNPDFRELVHRWITWRGRHIPIIIRTGRRVRSKSEYTEEELRALQRAEARRKAVIQVDKYYDDIQAFCERGVSIKNVTRTKVMAAVIKLINECYFRVGTERYATAHDTYGITSLRSRHVRIEGDNIFFRFVGKSKVMWERQITDARLAKLLQQLKDGAGDGPLFWYMEKGKRKVLTSDKVTRFLRRRWGIRAKDFRTYYATTLCFERLWMRQAKPNETLSKSEINRRVSVAVAETAVLMGHTPNVCRQSYLMPGLLQDFIESGGRFVMTPLR